MRNMMIVLVFGILLLGCVNPPPEANKTNVTNMAKSPAPTFRLMAMLQRGIIPALNNLKGSPLEIKFKKKYPPVNPSRAIVKNNIAPKLSKVDAAALESFLNAASLP